MDFSSPQFWVALMQIIAIDIMLGGDNAVVIALACRRLPEHQRNKGIFWGVFGAISARAVFLFFAVTLLTIPYLKIVGALLLLWIGVKLILPEDHGEDAEGKIQGGTTLWSAVKTVVIADVVMSLDNVIAVAAASKDSWTLAVLGVLISIPIVVWGSKIVLKLMDRFPIVIVFGAALLGWISGEMIVGDVVLKPFMEGLPGWLHYIAAALGALLVVATGKLITGKRARARKAAGEMPELASGESSATSDLR
jgi:YjbE family integral membrane protein